MKKMNPSKKVRREPPDASEGETSERDKEVDIEDHVKASKVDPKNEKCSVLTEGAEEKTKAVNLVDAKDNIWKTELYHAVEKRDMVRLAVLLRKGADVNLATKSGLTPLHEASLREYEDVCAVLLGANANVNVQNKWLDTPLHLASLNGHMRVVEMLVECGADVNLKNEYGNTARDDAMKHGHHQIARYLMISADLK